MKTRIVIVIIAIALSFSIGRTASFFVDRKIETAITSRSDEVSAGDLVTMRASQYLYYWATCIVLTGICFFAMRKRFSAELRNNILTCVLIVGLQYVVLPWI